MKLEITIDDEEERYSCVRGFNTMGTTEIQLTGDLVSLKTLFNALNDSKTHEIRIYLLADETDSDIDGVDTTGIEPYFEKICSLITYTSQFIPSVGLSETLALSIIGDIS